MTADVAVFSTAHVQKKEAWHEWRPSFVAAENGRPGNETSVEWADRDCSYSFTKRSV